MVSNNLTKTKHILYKPLRNVEIVHLLPKTKFVLQTMEYIEIRYRYMKNNNPFLKTAIYFKKSCCITVQQDAFPTIHVDLLKHR